MRTVLVVAGERDIREVLRQHLEHAGLSVLTAAGGAEALRHIDGTCPDVVLLDLDLPDIEGSDVLAHAARATRVVVLTSGSSPEDRIEELRLGADDCIVKPFSPTEVALRVRVVLGRGNRHGSSDGRSSFGGGLLLIDEVCHRVAVSGRELALTPHEWRLLVSLASAPGRVFSRGELVERIAGYQFEGYERAIDSHVKNARRKIGKDGRAVIETVVGFGYRLGLPADA